MVAYPAEPPFWSYFRIDGNPLTSASKWNGVANSTDMTSKNDP